MNDGFAFIIKDASVRIYRSGKLVKVIRKGADKFIEKANGMSENELQLLMAKETGKYKFGNERQAKHHPRNFEHDPWKNS